MIPMTINVYWDFKIFANSDKEVLPVLKSLENLLNLNIKSYNIQEYSKFTFSLFSLTIDSLLDAKTTEILDIKSLFLRVGIPIFIEQYHEEKYEIFEAIFDCRKHPAIIPEVFWARIYAEKPIITID